MKLWKTALVAGAVVLALALSVQSARADIALGITIQNTPDGVIVVEVTPGMIVDRNMPRLRPGAKIITVNGNAVTSAEQFQQIILASDYVRFEFLAPNGEKRWAVAWNNAGARFR